MPRFPKSTLPSIWPFGHVAELRRDMLGFFTRCAQECGDIALMKFGPRSVYLLNHPDHIEQALVTRNRAFSKHFAFKYLRPLLGTGLLTAEGDHWLRQRRLMQPAFSRESMNRYAPAMVELTSNMVSGWCDGQPLDIHAEMTDLTLQIAAKTLLDIDLGDQLRQVADGTDAVMDDFRLRLHSVAPLPIWIPTAQNRKMKQARAQLNAVIERIIAQRRQSGEMHSDLLSMMMRARDEDDGRGMSDRQLRDEVMTLLLAGHETTANTLSWVWYLLAQHSEAAAKLQAELQEVLGDRPPELGDLPRLVFTEQIVKEAMRLFPPAYTIGREATEDTTIGEYDVPRGTTVFACQWIVHRDSRWFPEPEQFQPQRWTEDFEQSRPKYAYFPFGGGPRVCIGNTFAMVEAVLLTARIAQEFSFELTGDKPIIPHAAVTLRPKDGIPVIATRLAERGILAGASSHRVRGTGL